MKFENIAFGNLSFSFFTGYFCIILWLVLLVSSTTPFYVEVAIEVKKIPIATILLASPLAIIVGVIFNRIRCSINKHVIKRNQYDFHSLPDEVGLAVLKIIHELLPSIGKEINENSFSTLKLFLTPNFDEYSVKSRWTHDFLDSTIYLCTIGITIVSIRVIITSLNSIDLYILITMSVAVLFSALSLRDLKETYTKSEASILLNEYRTRNKIES